jgi:hypothetical protein
MSPARLEKQTDAPLMNWERWLCNHASIFLFICIVLLFLLIVAVFVAISNVAAAPTGTEANLYYNHLEAII